MMSPKSDEEPGRNLSSGPSRIATSQVLRRVGPGLDSAIKPEFVAYSGNLTFDGFGSTYRTIRDDPGVAVMSLSHEPMRSLFSFDVGTSFGARSSPASAHLRDRLREALGEEPDPNLVRAVLATAAAVPQALRERIEPLHGEDGVLQVCGYGVIDEDHAAPFRGS